VFFHALLHVFSELYPVYAAILILRLYAMYGSDKRLLYGLVTFQILILLSQAILSALMFSRLKRMVLHDVMIYKIDAHIVTYSVTQLSPLTGCLPGNWVLRPWVYCLPGSVFDGLLLLLFATKSVQYLKDRPAYMPQLLLILLRDTFLYFGGVVAILFGNLLMWAVGGVGLHPFHMLYEFYVNC
jgi:hypothetical protein